MLRQRHKFDVDLLSYFLDAKLKHCSQMKLDLGFQNLSTWLCIELM